MINFLINRLRKTENKVHYTINYPEWCVKEETLLADNQQQTQNVIVASIRIETVLKYFFCFVWSIVDGSILIWSMDRWVSWRPVDG